jgi:hypothetical protein
MNSILKQLAKYRSLETVDEQQQHITVEQAKHPYQDIVDSLCDITNPLIREQTIGDALLVLNDFVPPPMTNKLYPLELAVLYYLFYYHQIMICGEEKADQLFGLFLKRTQELDVYMQTLKSSMDKTSISIFLYRIMLAALGARGKWDSKRDRLNKGFGFRAAKALGVEPTARAASRGFDSFKYAGVEQLILGRIAYIAFWEWSQTAQTSDCNDYLVTKQLPFANTPKLLPSHPTSVV